MLLERYLVPDRMAERYADVTPEQLTARGIRALICDIDNTLATYEEPDPPPDVVRWCAAMQEAGVRIAFVSNNDAERVERFNRPFGYPAYAKSGKPGGKYLLQAMRDMGSDTISTALLGDQLLTDAAAGKRLGLYVVIVPPIRDKKTLFFRFKRLLERPYINQYRRRHLPL